VLGFVSNRYAHVKCLIAIVLLSERRSFGNVVVEAMACDPLSSQPVAHSDRGRLWKTVGAGGESQKSPQKP